MRRPVLDLTVRHFTRELGDLTIIGTWYGADLEGMEPVLCLVPTFRALFDGTDLRSRPCCVALSSAYLYDEPSHLIYQSRVFCRAMGFNEELSTVHKIAEAIHGSLQDLIQMPPRPVLGTYVGADATITDGSGRQTTVELTRDF